MIVFSGNVYKGKDGKQYRLPQSPIAQGSEGSVYNVYDNPEIVAKLYKNGFNTEEKERKLIIMVDNPVRTQVSWPEDVLYDSNKNFVGVILPKLEIKEHLPAIYEYGTTAKYSDMPWTDKIIVAKNICVVLDAIHRAGYVVGDFNPTNICVDPCTGKVVFVDTDSYHVEKNGMVYRCSVGVSEYLPVEIQRKMEHGLSAASLPTFSKETDNFALAIHIFRLLMNGAHPFACKLLPTPASTRFPQPSDNIINGVFPFVQPDLGTTIPVYAPKIEILPKYMQELFERAFVKGHINPKIRPNAEEWYNALRQMQNEVVRCKSISSHEYHKESNDCPWCAIEKISFYDDLNYKSELSSMTKPEDIFTCDSLEEAKPDKRLKAIAEYLIRQFGKCPPFHCEDTIVFSSNPSCRYFLLLDENGFEVFDIVANERYCVGDKDDGWHSIYMDGELFVRHIYWDDENWQCKFDVRHCLAQDYDKIAINYNPLVERTNSSQSGYITRAVKVALAEISSDERSIPWEW